MEVFAAIETDIFLQPMQLLCCSGDDMVSQSFPESQTSPSQMQ